MRFLQIDQVKDRFFAGDLGDKYLEGLMGLEDGLAGEVPLKEKIAVRQQCTQQFFNQSCTTRDEVVAALDKMNIAWGDVRSMGDVRSLASVQARVSIAEVDDRAGGTRPIPQSPYRYANASAHVQGGASHLGEHNREILSEWLGWNESQISEYANVLVKGEVECETEGEVEA